MLLGSCVDADYHRLYSVTFVAEINLQKLLYKSHCTHTKCIEIVESFHDWPILPVQCNHTCALLVFVFT